MKKSHNLKILYTFFLCVGVCLGVSKESEKKDLPFITDKVVHNGTTFILQSKHQIPIFSEHKTYAWLSHPSKDGEFIAMIPIPYRQKSNIILYTKENEKKAKKQPIGQIAITQKPYNQEKISVPPNKVQYNQKIANRIESERKESAKIYNTFTPTRYWSKPFIVPLDSVITSAYGNARIFNGKLQSFHTGTDFRVAMNTPVPASNDGVVVLAKERYLSGNSVMIDHGEGVYSVYFHLESFKVKVGDVVKQGQIIALSGNTGRSSGAHLHFGIVINNTIIDPMDFIEKIKEIIEQK